MHLDGAAATVGNPAYRDAVHIGHLRVSAQGVLTQPAAGQMHIDMGAGMPAGQRFVVRGGERQREHVLVVGHRLPVDHTQYPCSVGRCRQA